MADSDKVKVELKKADPEPKKRYKALVGINYPDPRPGKPEKRANAGDEVNDLPKAAIPGLLDIKAIEEIKK